MVFPFGAQIWELAADHLDRLPGKSLIDRLVHESSMANDDHAAGANQPHECAERRSNEPYRDRDDIEGSVELRGGEALLPNLEIATLKPADQEHAHGDKDDVEQEPDVGEQSVKEEHHKDDGIVAREVAQIVVDAGLGFAEVGGLGEALHVEELGNGSQIGEPARNGARAEARKAVLDVQAGRQDVDGNLYPGHLGCLR